jgi:hypothetical protein
MRLVYVVPNNEGFTDVDTEQTVTTLVTIGLLVQMQLKTLDNVLFG